MLALLIMQFRLSVCIKQRSKEVGTAVWANAIGSIEILDEGLTVVHEFIVKRLALERNEALLLR